MEYLIVLLVLVYLIAGTSLTFGSLEGKKKPSKWVIGILILCWLPTTVVALFIDFVEVRRKYDD